MEPKCGRGPKCECYKGRLSNAQNCYQSRARAPKYDSVAILAQATETDGVDSPGYCTKGWHLNVNATGKCCQVNATAIEHRINGLKAKCGVVMFACLVNKQGAIGRLAAASHVTSADGSRSRLHEVTAFDPMSQFPSGSFNPYGGEGPSPVHMAGHSDDEPSIEDDGFGCGFFSAESDDQHERHEPWEEGPPLEWLIDDQGMHPPDI